MMLIVLWRGLYKDRLLSLPATQRYDDHTLLCGAIEDHHGLEWVIHVGSAYEGEI